jgi:hypothetical protein
MDDIERTDDRILRYSAGQDLVPAVRAALRGERYVSASTHWMPEPPGLGCP